MQGAQLADFVFLIDASSSMGNEIASVKSGLGQFVTGLNSASIDYRFAVILFGGAPELVLDFTSSESATSAAFNKISTGGAVSGFQNNHNANPEAGLETIRIALGGASNNTLARNNVGGTGGLAFRPNARKNLILVTDEDSDRPFFAENRAAGQSTVEPPNVLSTAWQSEVDATADVVIDNEAFVNLLVGSELPTYNQYGSPSASAQDADFQNFDLQQTYQNLVAAGYQNSLEGQILHSGLVGRAFNIGSINTPNFIDNFFQAKIEEIVDNPIPDNSVPDASGSLLLFLLGCGSLSLLRLQVSKA